MLKYDFKDDSYWYDENIIYNKSKDEQNFKERKKNVMGTNILQKLKRAKIGFGLDSGADERRMDALMDILPEQVYSNVAEWINDDEISEIKVKDTSMKELLEYTDLIDYPDKKIYHYYFYRLLELIGEYNTGHYENKKALFSEAFNRTYIC